MSKVNVKRIQTELDLKEYARFIRASKENKLYIKEAARQALEEWTAKRMVFNSKDTLFDFSITFKGGRDSSKKIDDTVYSKEAID